MTKENIEEIKLSFPINNSYPKDNNTYYLFLKFFDKEVILFARNNQDEDQVLLSVDTNKKIRIAGSNNFGFEFVR